MPDQLVPYTDAPSQAVRSGAHVTETFVAKLDAHWRLAKLLVDSELLPKAIARPEQALAIMLKGHELNLPPMQAFSSIHVIDGKPSLAASLMMALCVRDAGCKFNVLRKDAEGAQVQIQRPGWEPYTGTFVLEDAQRVKTRQYGKTIRLCEKDNWVNYPAAMYFSRAVSDACRTVCPDIMAGMYTPEELDADVVLNPMGEPVEVVRRGPDLASQAQAGMAALQGNLQATGTASTTAQAEIPPPVEVVAEVVQAPVPADDPDDVLPHGGEAQPLPALPFPVATDIAPPEEGLLVLSKGRGWYVLWDVAAGAMVDENNYRREALVPPPAPPAPEPEPEPAQVPEPPAPPSAAVEPNDAQPSTWPDTRLRTSIGTALKGAELPVPLVGDVAQTLFHGEAGLTDMEGRVVMDLLGHEQLVQVHSAVLDLVEVHSQGGEVHLLDRTTMQAKVVPGSTASATQSGLDL